MLKSIFNELLLSILCLFPLTLLCFLLQNIFTTYDWSYGLISFLFFFFLYYIWKDLSREELAIAKRYPAQTALCIRDGWEFCRPDHAAGA